MAEVLASHGVDGRQGQHDAVHGQCKVPGVLASAHGQYGGSKVAALTPDLAAVFGLLPARKPT
eukprot:3163171-Lingulodinium_polyedra.AAC.1